MTNPALSQSHFRLRNDAQAVDTAPTWIANVDTNATVRAGVAFRARFCVQETAGGNPAADGVKLQCNRNGGAFQDVTSSSSIVKGAPSASSSAEDTIINTARLGGTGTYVAGRYSNDGQPTSQADIAANGNTEWEFGIVIVEADVAEGDTITLKVVALTGTSITATTVPSITVTEKPPFGFMPPPPTDRYIRDRQPAIAATLAAAVAFNAFQPAGLIPSTVSSAVGWQGYGVEVGVAPIVIGDATLPVAPIPVPSAPANGWQGDFSEVDGYTVILDGGVVLPPQPPAAPAATYPEGWRPEYPALLAKPFQASQQQHAPWQAMDNVPSPVTPYGWWPSIASEVFKKTFIDRTFIDFPEFARVTFAAPLAEWPNLLRIARRDFSAADYPRFARAQVVGASVDFSIIIDKPLDVRLHQWASFQPQDNIVSITPQGFFPQHDLGKRPANALRFQFAPELPAYPYATQVLVIVEGWRPSFPDLYKRPFFEKPADNSFPEEGTIVSTTPQGWWQPHDVRITPRMRDGSHSVFAFVAATFTVPQREWPTLARRRGPDFGTIDAPEFVRAAFTEGWRSEFPAQVIARRQDGSRAVSAYPQVVVATPQGWVTFHEGARVRPPRLDGFVVVGQVQAAAVEGWRAQWPDAFRRPVTRHDPGQPIIFPAPAASGAPLAEGGWWTYPFRKHARAATLDRLAWGPRGNVPTATTPQGWWQPFSVAVVKPLRADRQRFWTFQPAGNIIPPIDIVAKPPLLGQDQTPSLKANDGTVQLSGLYGSVTLKGLVED